jgi:hypothetical protein
MKDVISEYHRWKQQGEGLRAEAMRAMETRYRDLLTEAIQIAEEYRADFGVGLKLPAGVTKFEYKSATGKKPKAAAVAPPAPVPASAPPPDAKLGPLEKRLAAAQKKLEAAKAAGAPTKNLEDKIYEIEDEIRLAKLR